MKIYILHDDEKKYYEALRAMEDVKELEVEVYHVHFIKTFIKGLIKIRFDMSIKAMQSAVFFFRSFFLSGATIILSLAPYDPSLLLWTRLAKRNRVIFNTSWPYWQGGNQPVKPAFFKELIRRVWRNFLLHKNTLIVCVLESTKIEMIKVFGKDKNKIFVIPHAVDTKCFKPVKRNHKVLKVLYSGRLVREKGLEDMVKVMESLDKEKYFFGIAGGGKDRRLIEPALKNSNVKYYGSVSPGADMAEIFSGYDVLLLPSYRTDTWEELFGIVVLEAFAAGLAVVATDCIGPKNLISHMKNGILVKQHDTDAIISRLEFLRNHKNTMKIITNAALQTVQKYRLENVMRLWRSLLGISNTPEKK